MDALKTRHEMSAIWSARVLGTRRGVKARLDTQTGASAEAGGRVREGRAPWRRQRAARRAGGERTEVREEVRYVVRDVGHLRVERLQLLLVQPADCCARDRASEPASGAEVHRRRAAAPSSAGERSSKSR